MIGARVVCMLWHIFQDFEIDRPVALVWWYPKDPHESQVSLGPCYLTAGARVAGSATMKVPCVYAIRPFL